MAIRVLDPVLRPVTFAVVYEGFVIIGFYTHLLRLSTSKVRTLHCLMSSLGLNLELILTYNGSLPRFLWSLCSAT